MACCSCAKGRFHLAKIDYKTKVFSYPVVVKNLWVELCDVCGETLTSWDAAKEIEAEIERVFPGYFIKVQHGKVQKRFRKQ